MLNCLTKARKTTNQTVKKIQNKVDREYFTIKALGCNKTMNFVENGEMKDTLCIWDINNSEEQLFTFKKIDDYDESQCPPNAPQRQFSTKFSDNKTRGAPCMCQSGKCECKLVNYYMIKCKGNRKYLTHIGLQNGATVTGKRRTGEKNQWFRIEQRIPGSHQYFIWSHSGKVLETRKKDTQNGVQITLDDYVAGQHQLWKIGKPFDQLDLIKGSSRSSSISSQSGKVPHQAVKQESSTHR